MMKYHIEENNLFCIRCKIFVCSEIGDSSDILKSFKGNITDYFFTNKFKKNSKYF